MLDTYHWAERRRLMNNAHNADQTEQAAIENGSAPAATGIDDDRLAGVTEDELDGPLSDSWSKRDAVIDDMSGETLNELERRATLLGSAYPFSISGSSLHYTGSITGIYEYCLATSLAPDVNSKKFLPLSVNFELLSCEITRRYLGVDAKALRIGWPSHDLNERPVKFKAVAAIVHKASGEWHWNPTPPNPDDPSHLHVKDEGVDYIVWIPMLDSRTGKLFLLGQCACGDNWDTKLNDISEFKLGNWLKPITSAPFVRAFSVPRHIIGTHIFHYCSSQAGITFDRARIAMIAEAAQHRSQMATIAQNLKLDDLTRLVIPRYSGVKSSLPNVR